MYLIIQFAVFYMCTWIYWNKNLVNFYGTAKYLRQLRSICYNNDEPIT